MENDGQAEEAKALYRKILASDPTHAKALLALGRILMEAGDTEQSLGREATVQGKTLYG